MWFFPWPPLLVLQQEYSCYDPPPLPGPFAAVIYSFKFSKHPGPFYYRISTPPQNPPEHVLQDVSFCSSKSKSAQNRGPVFLLYS